jgi:hypothetical protein
MTAAHVHVAGLAILITVATMIATQGLVRAFGARHPNAAMAGLNFCL